MTQELVDLAKLLRDLEACYEQDAWKYPANSYLRGHCHGKADAYGMAAKWLYEYLSHPSTTVVGTS